MSRRPLAAGILLAGLMAAAGAHATEIRPFVADSMAQIRAAHAGRPHLVALWSLDCPPCHEELAMLGRFARIHPDLRLVLISTDSPAEMPAILAALQRHGLEDRESWVFAGEFIERLRHEVDPAWRGELPRSYLNDSGETRAVSGRLDRAQLESWRRALSR